MDPVRNPFAPGAGTPPPELAGREELREIVRVALERIRRGLPTKSLLMVGLRGVGKTVLLDRMREDAEATAIHTIRIEAPEGRSLPALLAPELRQAMLRLSRNAKARDAECAADLLEQAAQQEAARQEATRQEAARQELARQEMARQDAARAEAARLGSVPAELTEAAAAR